MSRRDNGRRGAQWLAKGGDAMADLIDRGRAAPSRLCACPDCFGLEGWFVAPATGARIFTLIEDPTGCHARGLRGCWVWCGCVAERNRHDSPDFLDLPR